MIVFLSIPGGGSAGNVPNLFYIFGAICAGGGLTILANLIRRWRTGQLDDTEIIARITKDTVAGAKDILAEYRVEVEIVRRQLEDYRIQLNRLTRELVEANLRISNLEDELGKSHEQRERVVIYLRKAIEDRVRLEEEIKRLNLEIQRLLPSPRQEAP